MDWPIPEGLKSEHDELRQELAEVAPPGTRCAAFLAALRPHIESHMECEHAFALPPLAALPRLVSGRVNDSMTELLDLTERLRVELPRLLEDHARLRRAMIRLRALAAEESLPACAAFADRLVAHALVEEDVLYPAALVAGEYVKLRLGRVGAWPVAVPARTR